MTWFHSRGTGLLLKSFFVCSLVGFEVNAKTLIFQSSSESAQTAQPKVAPEVSAKPAFNASGGAVPSALPGSSVNSEMFFLVEQLTQEVMQLRGLVEEQGHRLKLLEGTAKDRYRDLDERILQLSKGQQFGASAPTKPSPTTPVVGAIVPVSVPSTPSETPVVGGLSAQSSDLETDEQKAEYQAAYAFVKNKQFPEAVDALHAYVEKYPAGDLTGNAFYWLGEVYLALPKLEQAKQALMIVVKTFPGHRKQADAMYKLAITCDRLQDPAQAEIYLKEVQDTFPGSTAAKLAESYALNR
jgi:tol-pal system protein YbgF